MKTGAWLCVTLALSVASAHAELITFDDLPSDLAVPNGYHGFDWTQVHLIDPDTGFSGSGYDTGRRSAPNVAFDYDGGGGEFSRAAPFDFNSVHVASAWFDQYVEFQGWRGPDLLYQLFVAVHTHGSRFVNVNFLGVDRVRFQGTGGSQVVLDDLRINAATSVAEPPMLALCLAVALTAARRLRGRLNIWSRGPASTRRVV